MKANRPSLGITLVEVLVIVALTAVGAALLLPALGAAREQARRAKCAENLRSIGSGILSYASTHGSYPISFIGRDRNYDNCGDSPTSYFGHTWMSFILPHIGETAAYNAINFSRSYIVSDQNTGFSSHIAAYLCPTDGRTDAIQSPTSFRTIQVSYAGMRGLTETFLCKWQKSNADRCGVVDSEGIFGATNLAYKPDDVTDGLATTIMVGEAGRFLKEPAGSEFNFGNVGSLWDGPPRDSTPAWPKDRRITAVAFGVPRINAGPYRSDPEACIKTAGNLADQWGAACRDLGQWGFRSRHPGGANFLLGDGSVRFIGETIEVSTYWSLATRASGEVVRNDEF